jgi:hypothetical protein
MAGNTTMTIRKGKAAVWFGRVMWLGILSNFALALPTLIVPERLIAMAGLPPASPLMWVRFSAWLLMLLSLLYIPGAVNLYRYRASAWLSTTSRLAGVLFFATQAAEYRLFGLFDFVFLVPEAILLTIALRHAPVDARLWEGSSAS